MEEDGDDFKDHVLRWGAKHNETREFFKRRDQLWKKMGFRALVTAESCQQVSLVDDLSGVVKGICRNIFFIILSSQVSLTLLKTYVQ